MVFIIVFIGVGGGVVSGCKLFIGFGGLVGYIGYMFVDLYGLVCGCGCIGCVEVIVFGCGIVVVVQGELVGVDVKIIFMCVGQGDEQVQQLIYCFVCMFVRLIVDIKVIIDCQCVVVGGSVGLVEGYLVLVEMYLVQELVVFYVDLLVVYYCYDVGLFGVVLLVQGEKL